MGYCIVRVEPSLFLVQYRATLTHTQSLRKHVLKVHRCRISPLDGCMKQRNLSFEPKADRFLKS